MISAEETLIEGRWMGDRGCALRDAACERIALLVTSYLRPLGAGAGTRTSLFEDPGDGRIWELSYPHSHLRAGGPPRLRVVSAEEVQARSSSG